jgi:hypothetical protein
MKVILLAAAVLVAGLFAVPAAAHAQGWSNHCGCHLGWSWRKYPPEYCCPPEWKWHSIRLRAYPNDFCQDWKGTVEPYDDNGLLLPPTSRPGMMPVSTDPLAPPKSSRRPEKLKTDTISRPKELR